MRLSSCSAIADRGIDRVGLLKFRKRLLKLSGGTEFLGRIHPRHRGLETDPFGGKLVCGIAGILEHRLFIEIERRFPLLTNLGLTALFQIIVALAGSRVRGGVGSNASMNAINAAKTLKTDML